VEEQQVKLSLDLQSWRLSWKNSKLDYRRSFSMLN